MFRAVQSVRSFSSTAACRQDLIQQTFVSKIREFAKNAGNLANSDPAVKKALQDELNRLATKFQLASADVVSKLPTNFENAKVDSAVQSALEGQTLAQLLEGVKKEHTELLLFRDWNAFQILVNFILINKRWWKPPKRRRRRVLRRKGVTFGDDTNERIAAATSDFIYAENKQWEFVASCFDLQDRRESREGDNDELLGLCNFFETEEGQPQLTDDSDEPLPFEVFAEQGMRISYKPPAAAPGTSVSSLHLSMLHLDSRPMIANTSRREEEGTSSNLLPDKDEIEKAFQGVLPCSNSQKTNTRRSSMSEKKKQPQESKPDPKEEFWDEDFWNNDF
ncbi:unnamed protein product [Caenorhabditis sp. 36 PRJEB53466]|nr:unnamed protein product [Caenorhabditis sp. 36 PRJEB53466]